MKQPFNLLPWRQNIYRSQQRRLLIEMLLCWFLIIGLFSILNISKQHWLHIQERKKISLQQQLHIFQQDIIKFDQLKQQLNQHFLIPLFIGQLSDLIPSGVYLKTLQQQDKGVILIGYAENTELIQTFIKQLKTAALFKQVKLKSVTHDQATGAFTEQFIIEADWL